LKWFGIVIIILFAGFLIYAEGEVGGYGDASAPPNLHVAPEYIKRSLSDTATPDVVTSVLADYRGYDTFGETTVIFTAGVICLMLLGGLKRDDK
jgi:multicomponent Na+:H+ antiporter subunit B